MPFNKAKPSFDLRKIGSRFNCFNTPSDNCFLPVASFAFPADSFDGFWAAASLLHIPKLNAVKVLDQIKNVVKSGGIGFFAVKEGDDERMVKGSLKGDERFFAFYKEEEFLKLLQENRFEVLEYKRDMREYNPPKNLTVWLLYFVKVK